MSPHDELPPHLQNLLDFLRRFIAENAYAPSVREMCAALGTSSTSVVHGRLKSLEEAGLIRRNPAISRSIVLAAAPGTFVVSGDAAGDSAFSPNVAGDTAGACGGAYDPGATDEGIVAGDLSLSNGAPRDNLSETAQKANTGHPEHPFLGASFYSLEYIEFDALFSKLSRHYTKDSRPADSPGYFNTKMPDESMLNRNIAQDDFLIVKRQYTAVSGDIVLVRAQGETYVRTYFKGLNKVRLQPESDHFETLPVDAADIEIYGVVIGFAHMF